MTTFLTACVIVLCVMIASAHVGANFLQGIYGRICAYLGIFLNILLYVAVGVLWHNFELTLIAMAYSLLLYLIIGAIRVKFFPSDKEGGK